MAMKSKRQFPRWKDLSLLLKFSFLTLPNREKRLAKALTIWDLRAIAKK